MEKATQFLYQEVRDKLMDLIAEKGLQPGEKLPSERQLAKQFGCNYQTVRKSFSILRGEQVVERRVGSGTYLLSRKPILPFGNKGNSKLGQKITRTKHFVPHIGLIIRSNQSEFDRELVHHIHSQALLRGYRLTIRPVSDFASQLKETAKELMALGCRAILLPHIAHSMPQPIIQSTIDELHIPIVLSDSILGLGKYCYEKPEVFGKPTLSATKMTCEYLKKLGYGHIAFLGANLPCETDLQRGVMAYLCFMEENGMESNLWLPKEDGPGCPNPEQVHQYIKQSSHLAGDLAVICWGDEYALRLIMAIHKTGLRIPEDIAVMGSGDIPLAKTFDPPLSTLGFDYDYVAKAMLNHAEALACGTSAQACGNPRTLLIARDSCGGKLRAGDNLQQIINDLTKSDENTSAVPESEGQETLAGVNNIKNAGKLCTTTSE